jgi:hypothetical protein
MQRPPGYRCAGSHVGRPHGGDKRRERQERTRQRGLDMGGPKGERIVAQIDAERARRYAVTP